MEMTRCPNDDHELDRVDKETLKCSLCEFTFEKVAAQNEIVQKWHEVGFRTSYSWEGQV